MDLLWGHPQVTIYFCIALFYFIAQKVPLLQTINPNKNCKKKKLDFVIVLVIVYSNNPR